MQEMVPESRNSPGWIVQRFGGANIRKFGAKIVEDIVKFVPSVSLYIGGGTILLTGIEQVSRKIE